MSSSSNKLIVGKLYAWQPIDTRGWVDRYGQSSLDDWPGKVHTDADLQELNGKESVWLKQALTEDAHLSEFTKLNTTRATVSRFFRTEQIRGKWWLVAPDGDLLFATGLDCVGSSPAALIDGISSGAYSWLPAERQRDSFSFYRLNLGRKWGLDALEKFQARTLERMKAWRFSSLGNWSNSDVIGLHAFPYVDMGPNTVAVKIPLVTSDICDAFHPAFEEEAMRVARPFASFSEDALLIGPFVGNEPKWAELNESVLKLDDKAPAKQELLKQLTAKYGTIDQLNAAWGTHEVSFNRLRWRGDKATKQARADMAQYSERFADRFYAVWEKAIKSADPNHLVLGCRFANYSDEIVAACARHSDIVSFNVYEYEPDKFKFDRLYSIAQKPLLIGEYALDSLDAGLLTTYVPVENQHERAVGYRYYTENAAALPYLVGCYYFQYIDEPVTGRHPDRETSFNGFVSVADVPYMELVMAARLTNARVSRLHEGSLTPFSEKPQR